MSQVAVVYALLVGLLSPITLVAFGIDKRRSMRDGRRIPEKTLHLYAMCGGWPGALLGQRLFRHKTRKQPFVLILWSIVGLHLAWIGWLIYELA